MPTAGVPLCPWGHLELQPLVAQEEEDSSFQRNLGTKEQQDLHRGSPGAALQPSQPAMGETARNVVFVINPAPNTAWSRSLCSHKPLAALTETQEEAKQTLPSPGPTKLPARSSGEEYFNIF